MTGFVRLMNTFLSSNYIPQMFVMFFMNPESSVNKNLLNVISIKYVIYTMCPPKKLAFVMVMGL